MKRLRNSSGFSDATIREVEAFVMPPGGVGTYDLEARKSQYDCTGRAYWAGSAYHTTARPFIVARIGPDRLFPRPPLPNRGKPGYLPRPYLANRVEALVYLLAHELRHLWQARVPKGRRVWGSRGQFSERDADAYAIRMLRQWRKQPLTDTR